MRTLPVFSPVLLAALTLSCNWEPDPNDAGDEAFVAQAIEAILGRKPHGAAEVKALSDLSVSHGRDAVVDALFELPEYVTYWSQVLADDLEVQRAGAMAVDADCMAPALLSPTSSGSLAHHLANAPASSEYCVHVDIGPTPSFSERTFWAEFAEAEASYRHTPITSLREPEPLTRTAARSRPVAPTTPRDASRYPDLELQGGSATNRGAVLDDGQGVVATEVDQRRYEALSGGGPVTCPTFNLTDVVEAAIRADRLDAAYRAYLPVFSTFPGSSDDAAMRDQLGGMFLDVYVNRDPACMTCHTATYSTTDARPLNANWDRFYAVWHGLPIPLDAEGTVFSYGDASLGFVYGGDGGDDVRKRTTNLFRRANHVQQGIIPWGMDETCVTNPARQFGGFDDTLPLDSAGNGPTAFAGLGPASDLGVLALTEALSDATQTFDTDLAFTTPDWAGFRTARGASDPGFDPGCGGCHDADPSNPGFASVEAAPFLEFKVVGLSDQRLFSIIRNGSGEMPSWADTDDEAWDYVWWVRDHYQEAPGLEMVDRNHGFLYLLSANLVNQVVDEVLGEDLLMEHGFSRNADQSQLMSELTMAFVEQYSLQDLLRTIVLSDAFNRLPPSDPGTDPYVLPMLPFPEAEVSPLVTSPPIGADANSEGDYVHKVSPSGILHQVHQALGWPRPPLQGDPVAYPTQALMTAIGRYTSRDQREREQFGIDTFLVYEDEVASCQKPALVRARDVTLAAGSTAAPSDLVGPDEWVDWIDLFVEDAVASGEKPTWAELGLGVKDRLLADPTYLPGEEDALWELIDSKSLESSPLGDAWFSPTEVDALREYCGVLMKTPDFVLRGVRLAPPIPEKYDADPVCLPGELCGYEPIHKETLSVIERLGYRPIDGRVADR